MQVHFPQAYPRRHKCITFPDNEGSNKISQHTEYVDNLSDKFAYETNIKHLLYLIVPAFVIKYGLKKESKIFYVNGDVFSQDYCDEVPDLLKRKARKIADILKLECFSFDLIETGNSVFVIDVNPASGFFTSKNARKSFLKMIKEKIVKKVTQK